MIFSVRFFVINFYHSVQEIEDKWEQIKNEYHVITMSLGHLMYYYQVLYKKHSDQLQIVHIQFKLTFQIISFS